MATETPRRSPADLLARITGKVRPTEPAAATAVAEPPPEEQPAEILDARDGITSAVKPDEEPLPDELDLIACGRGGVTALRRASAQSDHAHLEELFNRVSSLLGDMQPDANEQFRPRVPNSLEEARLTEEDVERLIFKYLLLKGSGSGRELCQQIKVPYALIEPLLKSWKHQQLLALKSAAEMGDYVFAITEIGRERARRYIEECTYFGAAPVALPDYLQAMAAQSIAKQEATEDDLKRGLRRPADQRERCWRSSARRSTPAAGCSCSATPGNGKTSIAERITDCFGTTHLDSARAGHRRRHHPPVRPRRARGGRPVEPATGCSTSPASTSAGCRSSARRSSPAAN